MLVSQAQSRKVRIILVKATLQDTDISWHFLYGNTWSHHQSTAVTEIRDCNATWGQEKKRRRVLFKSIQYVGWRTGVKFREISPSQWLIPYAAAIWDEKFPLPNQFRHMGFGTQHSDCDKCEPDSSNFTFPYISPASAIAELIRGLPLTL